MEQVGDVLIVGAGPAGLLTALGLGQAGLKVVVIEAEDDLSEAPRAMVYMQSTIAALDGYGLLGDVTAQSLVGKRFACHIPEFGFKATVSHDVVTGITYDYNLHCGQNKIARIAMKHGEAHGVETLFGTRLTAIEQDGHGVVATAETPMGEKKFRTKYLIGADGARSAVRKLMNIEFEGHTWAERFVATNVYYPFEKLGYEASNFVLDPSHGRVVAAIDNDGLWRVTYAESSALPEETFMERLQERYRHFVPEGEKYDLLTARPYNIHQRAAATLRKGRVLLVGDAAHATNPTGGMGLTTGIWDTCILSDILPAVISGEESDTILDRYSDERRRVFWDISSPNASQNKRMMEEGDPVQRKQDMETVKAGSEDPVGQKMMMLFPFRVIGDTLRADSRWKDTDPTPRAGLDLGERVGQIA
ncbi:FAD-dependent oxidoreductase [Sphingobium sp. EP60837]|uniref:FAD-dependent oxidoreductase n=1 Tax=Sphingobium sp. EP60837 TaxID=1855519 RepID=UPI0007DDF75A|nr:FAD-dependent oxidoreductase [Sphingobium sp. EP60837]ANI80229.1 Phenol 2-monooxygenase (NADPH) [Sphingobium sp. EP60837]